MENIGMASMPLRLLRHASLADDQDLGGLSTVGVGIAPEYALFGLLRVPGSLRQVFEARLSLGLMSLLSSCRRNVMGILQDFWVLRREECRESYHG